MADELARLAPLLNGRISRTVVLVGLMGAGKSCVGRRLAARLGLDFVDSDAEFEAASGSSISDYFARHNIKPGITGLAQVRGFRGETKDIEQMIQRVESDIEYINNWSLWLDFTILLRTTAAFTGKYAY